MSKRNICVLIVEDIKEVRNRYSKLFKKLTPEFIEQYGSVPFDVKATSNMTEAINMLDEYRSSGKPFDIALIDLNILPDKNGKKGDELIEYGEAVLDSFRPNDGTAVVVISDHYNFKLAGKAFKAGALDYLAKPVMPQKRILDAAMSAWHKTWLRCRNQDLGVRLARFNWALEQSQDEVVDRFASLLTDNTRILFDELENLSGQLKERYMLSIERDTSDPIVKSIHSMNESLQFTLEKVSKIRSQDIRAKAHYEMTDLIDLTKEVISKLWPSFVFHHIRPILPENNGSEFKVKTFVEDLRSILEEMFFGAINAYPVLNGKDPIAKDWKNIDIKLEQKEQSIYISVIDRAKAIEQFLCDLIRKGDPVDSDDQRAWGLSLAQRMAHNIGASINVASNEKGENCISLQIPVL